MQFGRTVERIKSMDSSSTKDMDSLVISGDTLAAEDSSSLAGDPVLDVLLSDSTRQELDVVGYSYSYSTVICISV